MITRKKTLLAIFVLLASTLTLSSCSKSEPAVEKVAAVSISEPVARSIDGMSSKSKKSGKYMTGAFMNISNASDAVVTLTGGTSPDAGYIEIHEVINGEMTPMANGLDIPANNSVKLRMGGYHVMLMDLAKEIKAGDEVSFSLNFSDGSTINVTAPVKDIAMDDEIYGVEKGM